MKTIWLLRNGKREGGDFQLGRGRDEILSKIFKQEWEQPVSLHLGSGRVWESFLHFGIGMDCDAPTRHPVLGKGVTNMRTINLLTYIILKNYLENINLQKYFIYIHCCGIYSVLYIYYKSHLLVLLGSHYLQNITFTLTK